MANVPQWQAEGDWFDVCKCNMPVNQFFRDLGRRLGRSNIRSRFVACSRSILDAAMSHASASQASIALLGSPASGSRPFTCRKTRHAASAVRLFPSMNGWLRER